MKKTLLKLSIVLVAAVVIFGCLILIKQDAIRIYVGSEGLVYSENEAVFIVTATAKKNSGSLFDWLKAEIQWRSNAATDALQVDSRSTTFLFRVTRDRIEFGNDELPLHAFIYPTNGGLYLICKENGREIFQFKDGKFIEINVAETEIFNNKNIGYSELLRRFGWTYDSLSELLYEDGTGKTELIQGTDAILEIEKFEPGSKNKNLQTIRITSGDGNEIVLSIYESGKWSISDSDAILKSGTLPRF